MSCTASGPHKRFTVKSWRQIKKKKKKGIQNSPCNPALRPTLSFLFLSLPLQQRAQRLLSGCNQSLFCAWCNLMSPLFSLKISKRGIQSFLSRTLGRNKTFISSPHCRAMTNVPLFCDKSGFKTRDTPNFGCCFTKELALVMRGALEETESNYVQVLEEKV